MKKNWLSWILWLPPFGLLGMHKLYLDNPLMALIYFFTGGGCIFGWITDAFSMSRQVEEANRKTINQVKEHIKEQLLEGSSQNHIEERVIDAIVSGVPSGSPTRRDSASPPTVSDDLEKRILKLAYEQRGKVTVGDVAVNTEVSLSEAEKALNEMSKRGYCGVNVTENGKVEYEFEGLFTES